jgi:hypothetical protein
MPINNILPKKNSRKPAPAPKPKAKKRHAKQPIAPEGRR